MSTTRQGWTSGRCGNDKPYRLKTTLIQQAGNRTKPGHPSSSLGQHPPDIRMMQKVQISSAVALRA